MKTSQKIGCRVEWLFSLAEQPEARFTPGAHTELKRFQAETAAELDALLDRAFKGDL